MCDQRVLCPCLSYAFLYDMYYMLYYVSLRPDRRVQRTMRPGGSQTDRTGGSNELWHSRVPLRHIDSRVLQSYNIKWLIICAWYFGELTKLRAYRFMCYVFKVLPRITGRHRLDCTHTPELQLCLLWILDL